MAVVTLQPLGTHVFVRSPEHTTLAEFEAWAEANGLEPVAAHTGPLGEVRGMARVPFETEARP